MKLLRVCAVALLLSGCGSKDYGTMPEEEFGDLAEEGVVFATDKVQEVAVRSSAYKAHVTAHKEAHNASGLDVEFQAVEINGVTAYMPKKISFREKPEFGKAPSLDKAPHPGWRIAGDVVESGMKYGLVGYGVHEGAKVLGAMFDGLKSSNETSFSASGGGTIKYSSNQSEVHSGGNAVGTASSSEANREIGAVYEESSEEHSGESVGRTEEDWT